MRKQELKKLRAEFLPEALEIVEKPISPIGHIIVWFVFLVILCFIIWACIGSMEEVAVARGQVLADDGVQQIQSASDGVISKVYVQPGEKVEEGDLLYSLDSQIEKANINYSEDQSGILQFKIELLNKMLEGSDLIEYKKKEVSIEFQEVLDSMITLNDSEGYSIKEYEIAVENAKNQYELKKEESGILEEQEKYLDKKEEIKEKSQKIKSTLQIEIELLEKKIVKLEDEVEKYKTLYEAGAKAKIEWEDKKYELEELKKELEIKKVEQKQEKLQDEASEVEMDYEKLQEDSQTQAYNTELEKLKENYDLAVANLESAKKQREVKLSEMKETYTAELEKYGVSMEELYYTYENKDIKAMYDGVVKEIYVEKEGAVVTPTQVLAEIIPDAEQLIVEAEVKNSDIGFVEVGQEVDVKLDTYNYQKYGKLTGTVLYISPDAIENEKQEKNYSVRIILDGIQLEKEEKHRVAQGMECTVEIVTDKRKIIEFFIEPLFDALDNSLNIR